ncbi:MAG: fibronectin type III domain-containing protein [Clostridiales bacterium]|nr:fibronectin type III domain-containing protein [Clostridiales bacterium]
MKKSRHYKRIILTIVSAIISFNSFSQEIVYTISGVFNNQKLSLDSIQFENLSNGTSLTFSELLKQQIYQINLSTKQLNNNTIAIESKYFKDSYQLIRNIPGQISISFNSSIRSGINLNVYNIEGQLLYNTEYKDIGRGSIINIILPYSGIYIVELRNNFGSITYKGVGAPEVGQLKSSLEVKGSSNARMLKSAIQTRGSDFNFCYGDSLRVSIYLEGYYSRPKVLEIVESTNLEYTLNISSVTTEGISEGYVKISDEIQSFVEYNIHNGNVTFPIVDGSIDIYPGDIMTIDADTTGFLRKVIGIKEDHGKIVFETQQALMSELFVNKEFSLSTELFEPNQVLNSTSSLEEISDALVDERGFIHPVEIIYTDSYGGTIRKSVLDLNDNVDSTDIININYPFSGESIVGNEGETVNLYAEEGYVKFNSNAVFSFKFNIDEEIDENTKIHKGDLEYFEFYLENTVDVLARLTLNTQKDINNSYQDDLHHFSPVTAKFIIPPGVPVWIKFQVDLLKNIDVDASTSLDAEWGFHSIRANKTGGRYDNINDKLIPINESEKIDTVFHLIVDEKSNAYSRFEVYPRIEMKFYSYLGPYAEVAPYVTGEVYLKNHEVNTSSGTKNTAFWNSKIDLGLDLRLGMTVDFILRNKDIPMEPISFPTYTFWESPDNIELISELPTNPEFGQSYPIIFSVTDNLDQPVSGCPVYMFSEGYSSAEVKYTDFLGQVEFLWIIGENAGDYSYTSQIFNSDFEIVDEFTYIFEIPATKATLTTVKPNSISSTKANSGGSVISNGGSQITSKGVCWSTKSEPTIQDDKTNDGTGLGDFKSYIFDLDPGKKYYIRAYAINEAGVAYGGQYSFTTSTSTTSPIITTYSLSDITTNSATSGGNVTSDGGTPVTSRGVCWNTTGSPTTSDTKTSDGDGAGSFNSSLTSLTPNNQYYIRAYAINSVGTSYGSEKSFFTLSFGPSELIVTAKSESEISLAWTESGETVDGFYVYYSTDNNTFTLLTETTPNINSYNVINLSTGYTYYFKVTAFKGKEESEAATKALPFYHWTINNYFVLPPASDNNGIPIVSNVTSTIYGNTLANFPLESEVLWSIEYFCDIGSQSGDDFIVTPTDNDIGNHTFRIVLKYEDEVYATQTTSLSVYSKTHSGTKSIMAFGNSLMYSGFDHEMDIITGIFDDMTLNTIGVFTLDSYKHNAISGYHYARYCTSSQSPLVKDGEFNVPAFFTDNSLSTPDYVYVRLGVNDINNQTPDGMTEAELITILTYMEQFVNAFLDYDANIKIIIGLPSYCTSIKTVWDNDYDGTKYENRHDIFIENAHRFYVELINNYRNSQYNSRVYIDYAGFHLNRKNYRDAIHTDNAGSEQLGLGFANIFARSLTE